ncbi:MAG TPA: FxLYD domain-containing protein [Dehalococcoidia bacterium]|nr:FxLYD domain-containing protein [Dehalococcoidia bacterium]
MKKWLALGLLATLAVAATAATCVVRNVRITVIDDDAVVAGEMFNDSGVDILNHEILVAFLDKDNDLIDTASVVPCPRSLQDGTSSFFAASDSTIDPDDVKNSLWRINFNNSFKVGQTEDSDITISNVFARRLGDDLKVTGTVKNNGEDELEDVVVCIVVRDEDGKVVTVGKDASVSDLDEDDTDTFSITINNVSDDDDVVTEVDVWVDGEIDGTLAEPASDTGNDVDECSAATNTPTPGTPTDTPTPNPTITPSPTATPCF